MNATRFVDADARSISYRMDVPAKIFGSLSKLQGKSLGKRFSCCLSDVVAALNAEEVGVGPTATDALSAMRTSPVLLGSRSGIEV